MADNFAKKYTGFKQSGGKQQEKRPPLPRCRCGGEAMLVVAPENTVCRDCYERERDLSPTEMAVLDRRLNVPLRIEGESSIAYFLRAYAASTEKRNDE